MNVNPDKVVRNINIDLRRIGKLVFKETHSTKITLGMNYKLVLRNVNVVSGAYAHSVY